MTQIIAFAGRKQSGKTTCSQDIVRYYETFYPEMLDQIKIYNFADPLKQDICMKLLGLTYDQCYGTDNNKNELTDNYLDGKQMSAREVMQFIGTHIFRKIKHNIWADATIKKINEEKPSIALIADCRFPNEVEAIKKAGGLVIKLTRNPFNSDHASETALDQKNYNFHNFDTVIFNHNLTLEQQTYAVLSFLKKKGILPL